MKTKVAVVGLTLMTQAAAAGTASAGSGGSTTRESVSSTGAQANGHSFLSGPGGQSLSADGRYIAFGSQARNLVPGDTNGLVDVFVRDRVTGVTQRVSVGPAGEQGVGNGLGASAVAISADGWHVAFISDQSNLVPGDTNNADDLFVRDVRAGVTQLVPVAPAGETLLDPPRLVKLSADGRLVVYTDYGRLVGGIISHQNVYVYDLVAGVAERVSVGLRDREPNNDSWAPAISADGRSIAFMSKASNLVRGDTNHTWDVFVRDRLAGVNQRVSVDSAGRQGLEYMNSEYPSISADGRFVAFDTGAQLVPADTDSWLDVYVRDRLAGTTRRVSVVGPAGRPANTGANSQPAISADGQIVAFQSNATNLVPGDTNGRDDVFVRDRRTQVTRRVSVSSSGRQGRDDSGGASLSADGRSVAFVSRAPNLVAGDTNDAYDVFVRDRRWRAGRPDPGLAW